MDQWTVLSIPALLDKAGSTLLGYSSGSSYWPEFWTKGALESTKANMPDYQWEALYMQRPTVESGAILKREYWQPWTGGDKVDSDFVLMSIDTAGSTEDEAANSAMTLWAVFNDDTKMTKVVLLAAKKGRWAYPDLKANVMEWNRQYAPDVILVEKKSTGQSLIPEMRLADLPVVEYFPDKDRDKVARAHAVTPTLAAHRVYIPMDKQWAQRFITECAEFPKGREKDFVDTMSQALLWLRRNGFFELKEDWKEEPAETLRRKRKSPY